MHACVSVTVNINTDILHEHTGFCKLACCACGVTCSLKCSMCECIIVSLNLMCCDASLQFVCVCEHVRRHVYMYIYIYAYPCSACSHVVRSEVYMYIHFHFRKERFAQYFSAENVRPSSTSGKTPRCTASITSALHRIRLTLQYGIRVDIPYLLIRGPQGVWV